jgi:hypothetical protein
MQLFVCVFPRPIALCVEDCRVCEEISYCTRDSGVARQPCWMGYASPAPTRTWRQTVHRSLPNAAPRPPRDLAGSQEIASELLHAGYAVQRSPRLINVGI